MFDSNAYTVVSALAHAPWEPRKACAIAKRALKRTFYIVKIDLVIASQRAVMLIVRQSGVRQYGHHCIAPNSLIMQFSIAVWLRFKLLHVSLIIPHHYYKLQMYHSMIILE